MLEDQADPLAEYRWKARVLVILAADATNVNVIEQQRAFEGLEGSAQDRQLVLILALPGSPGAGALRSRLGISEEPFRVVLVGKDGHPKLSSDQPISAHQLIATIDAMPMRQREMRQHLSVRET
jgi:hypothetical protein